MLYKKTDQIANYEVIFPIREGRYAETYRVKDSSGKKFFLKLLCTTKLGRWQIDENGKINEIEIYKISNHHNICNYVDDGTVIINGQQYAYLVTEYIGGETLFQSVNANKEFSVYDTKEIAVHVLSALSYLHGQERPIIHNNVTIEGVLQDLNTGLLSDVKLIDFGNARFLDQPLVRQEIENINPFYIAPERFSGACSVQSDLYSVGALMYHLLFGRMPWFVDLSRVEPESRIDYLNQSRKKELEIPNSELFELDEQLINTIKTALAYDVADRFSSADEFIRAIQGDIVVEHPNNNRKVKIGGSEETTTEHIKPAKGNGFAAIAGMQELKDTLQEEVIDVLREPEKYAQYGLSIPNGMLLYGPPRCGKTFFAKHFAEEVGYNYMFFKPGTLKSHFVNETEKNISKMFKEAIEKAPTIIFIEEINGLFPRRDKGSSSVHEMSSNAVDAILAEMDNTGKQGVFVVCATNYPDRIDPALLGAGRLEKKYYIGPPDKEAREAMFKLNLQHRPYEIGIDYDKLAELTENFVSADIELIVNAASRMALKQGAKITMAMLEEVIANTMPSVPLKELRHFDEVRKRFENQQDDS
ncbi:MAG: AAA family ATPase, partial [Bacteroidales bacterium]|nr:AAA family ATPase [Bacteroidales bacterium]